MLEALADNLHYTVALVARRRVFVRAGVVGWHGKAIVILEPNHSEVAFLVAALVRAEATSFFRYIRRIRYSRARPRLSSSPLAAERDRSATAEPVSKGTRGTSGCEPLPGSLWSSPRNTSAARAGLPASSCQARQCTRPCRVPRDQRHQPAFTLEALGNAAATAVALKGKCGETEAVAKAILRHLEDGFGATLEPAISISPLGKSFEPGGLRCVPRGGKLI